MSVSVIGPLAAATAVALAGSAARRRPRPAGDEPRSQRSVRLAGRSHRARRAPNPETALDVAGCLDELSRQVRAGRSLGAAIEGATVEPVAAIARQLLTGTPLAQAARAALTGVGRGSDDAIALSAVTVSADLGGNQALALDLAASSLRDRAAQRSEMNAASATARLSAKVVGGLPLAAGLWLLGTDRGARSFLAGSRAGVICLVVSAGLQVLGWSWIGRLVSAVE